MLLTLGQKKAAILTNGDPYVMKVYPKKMEQCTYSLSVIGIGSDRACVVAVKARASSA